MYPVTAGISGIGGSAFSRVDRIVPITIVSTSGKGMNFSTDALIMDFLTNYVPRFQSFVMLGASSGIAARG